MDVSDHPVPALEELPPPDAFDPVIEAYKRGVDRTLLRENLKLTVPERLLKLQAFLRFVEGLRAAKVRDVTGSGRKDGR